MAGLAHVALHVVLCGPITRLPSQANFAMRVRVSDKINRAQVDRTFSLQRGFDRETIVEFDSPPGAYRLDISVPRYGCSASDFVFFIPDRTRNIEEHLESRGASFTAGIPVLLSGTTPAAFSYVHPEFVAVERSAVCNQPVSNVLPIRSSIETDQDSYYARLYAPQPSVAPESLNIVIKLRTAAAQYHYVRIPLRFPLALRNWPDADQMNIPEDYIDALATEPVDTLLCPKFSIVTIS